MNIYGKSTLTPVIFDKMNKGANGIEIHLNNEFIKKDFDFKKDMNISLIEQVPIYVVHIPIVDEIVDIETIESREVLKRIVPFASYIANKQHHSILIVVHLSTSIKTLKNLRVYDNIINDLCNIVKENDNIEIGIENVMNFHQDTKYFALYNLFQDNVQLAKDCNHPRIGSVLDICHTLSDISFLTYLQNYLDLPIDKFYSLEDYFKINKDSIKLMHLANKIGNGSMKNHGTPFTKNDLDLLSQIMKFYNQYEYKCPITLEVREDNYEDAKNFKTTLDSLNFVLNTKLNYP